MWTEDEAGPYQTLPYPGAHWQPTGLPGRYPHDYVRRGTEKQLTLFHPASGAVRVKGVRRCTNAVLHPWLEVELAQILAAVPEPTEILSGTEKRRCWECWQEGLMVRITLPAVFTAAPDVARAGQPHRPSHRIVRPLVVRPRHHAAGHAPRWQLAESAQRAPAESIQRILTRRALAGYHPQTPEEIIARLEATADGWNWAPTPFVWGGKRQVRGERARQRRHALGGSGACSVLPLAWDRAAWRYGDNQPN